MSEIRHATLHRHQSVLRNILWILMTVICSAGVPFSAAQSVMVDAFNPAANADISAIAIQADGRVIVGGKFTQLGGTIRSRLARLHADGTLDLSFPAEANDEVQALVIQPDSSILVRGKFTRLGNQTRNYLARLRADGTLDESFNPAPDGTVDALALQPDGMILVGGRFSIIAGQPRQRMARLLGNGAVDSTFNPNPNSWVTSIALEADGRILVAGNFVQISGQPRERIARLFENGAADDSFAPSVNGAANCLFVQPDGRILLAGPFTAMAGQTRVALGRLLPDGALDAGFNPATNWFVHSLAQQTDGKLLVGGYFTTLAQQPRQHLGRLNADGTLDPLFNPSAGSWVSAVAMQADGRVLLGGDFLFIAGSQRSHLARLQNDGVATQLLHHATNTITWLRGGQSPEVRRTTFESSDDGLSWTMLGPGTRVPGGWERTTSVPSSNARLRARGYISGAFANGSEWFTESYLGAPTIIVQPQSSTNDVGTPAQFRVAVGGSGTLACQWFKNGSALIDQGRVTGSAGTTLSINPGLADDEGAYHVVVSNAFGAVTSSVVTLTIIDPLFILQPSGGSRNVGEWFSLSATVIGTQPTSYQWLRDSLPLAGATNATLLLDNLQRSDAGSYRVEATNLHGRAVSQPALLIVNAASLDQSFSPDPNLRVNALAVQPDRKILIGGDFTMMRGEARSRLARVYPDGTLDDTFNPGAVGSVYALAVREDGRILVGGTFTGLGGQTRSAIGQLLPHGVTDLSFDPGANGAVLAFAVQPDGKILVSGQFSAIAGNARSRLARLNADGSLDTNFNAAANSDVYAIALQSDGRILIGGYFSTIAGQPRPCLARLLPDGSVDWAFNPGADSYVGSIVVQPDGRIVIGGGFTSVAGQPRSRLARLDGNGVLDNSFTPAPDGNVNSLALQTDGRILVGGNFATLRGQARARLGRLNQDGSPDMTFNPGANNAIQCLVLQPDGGILVGGDFTVIGGETRRHVARLHNTDSATHSLTHDASSITWIREGTSPEVWRTTFEMFSSNTWTLLGSGERVDGGWRLSGLNLASSVSLRARGHVQNGEGSPWFVEQYRQLPVQLEAPVDLTANAGATAGFRVAASGSEPVYYQWLKDGVPLTPLFGTRITGTQSPTLTMLNVLDADEGAYSVRLSNAFGSSTSSIAMLTVNDPYISQQPAGANRTVGENAFLTITVRGTSPLTYQWLRDGVPVAGAVESMLTISNLVASDAGRYTVTVTNPSGNSVTSAPAMLNVNAAVVDGTFNPNSDGSVHALAVQPDGKVLVGGWFTSISNVVRPRLARLHPSGALDSAFNAVVSQDGAVNAIAIQDDGKIVIGGTFTSVGGLTRVRIARLTADGLPDAAFNHLADNSITCLAIQPDGRILLGGWFTNVAGMRQPRLARLNTDGTPDGTFAPAFDSGVYTIALQTDGRIVVGGDFDIVNGQTRNGIARLNADGTLDTGFDPGASGSVYAIAIDPAGNILVGGSFFTLGGQSRIHLGRLLPNGTVDPAFNPVASYSVSTIALQTDGRILVGGNFDTLGGEARNRIGRLHHDGTIDSTFNPGASHGVLALALQVDGSILAGGGFTDIGGVARRALARIRNTGSAIQTMAPDGLDLLWSQSGTGPEATSARFAHTTNGTDWAHLGEGERHGGGWKLSGVPIPADGVVRVRGRIVGGQGNGSSWFVEQQFGAPLIVSTPASRTNLAGSTASFNVRSVGSDVDSYRWFKDGVALWDAANIAGAGTSNLFVSQVFKADEGSYTVVLSNSLSSVTSQVATLTVIDPIITQHPSSATRNVGVAAFFGSAALGTPPLSFQWHRNGEPLPGATETNLQLLAVRPEDAGLYTMVAVNAHSSVTSAPATLVVAAAVDTTFNPGAGSTVLSLATRADGKLFVGGAFITLSNLTRGGLGRLNADGSVDATYNPGATNTVYSLALQPDGKLLVGGSFTSLGGKAQSGLGRLNADGSLDRSFNPGATNTVFAVAVQPDGGIVVGGTFTTLGGQSRRSLGRLHADGTLDSIFAPQADSNVLTLAIQPDSKILVGGSFTNLAGQARNHLARLNPDGSIDGAFTPSANSMVSTLALQPDGKILVGGTFTNLNGRLRNRMARLHADGTLDETLDPNASGPVLSIIVQTDGSILVGGVFTTLGRQNRNYVGRLRPDGSVDPTFSLGASSTLDALLLQDDGKVVVGGTFTTFGGQLRGFIARVINSVSAQQSLDADARAITWTRRGAVPEISSATLEQSADGMNWTTLGDGQRTADGWQWTNTVAPLQGAWRARGRATGGYQNGSSWFTESYRGAPVFLLLPSNRTNIASTTASFTVTGFSSESFTHQWLKDGMPLANAGKIAGAGSASLVISNVLGADAGGYSVVLSNASGSVTSTVATLTVREPYILRQPTGTNQIASGSATFSIIVTGTPPFTHQWHHDTNALTGATGAVLTLSNLSGTASGQYRVVVGSAFGSVTSAPATLNVSVGLDTNFNPGANNWISALAVQPDGGTLVGGQFTQFGGGIRNRIARLKPDGTLDASFNPNADGDVYSICLETDGRILICGAFYSVGGHEQRYLARLRPDGSPDTTFPTIVNDRVYSVVKQPDGRILIGGSFTNVNGQSRRCLARLHEDGTLDETFVAGTDLSVSTVALQSDGKILVGGLFSTVNGQPRGGLARLHPDGTLDAAFNPPALTTRCFALQTDGRILVGGEFNAQGGQLRNLCRLNTNGTLDTTFNVPANSTVSSLALQADGQVLVGGHFTTLAGQTRNRLGRIRTDGTLDPLFTVAASAEVYSIALQADGKILVGGYFFTIGGTTRNRIARLNNNVVPTQSLDIEDGTITWRRGGSAPEVWRTTFDYSPDGTNWIDLGAGSRIAGGWQAGGAASPSNSLLRARGFILGGMHNNAGGIVETLFNPLIRLRLQRSGSSMILNWTGGRAPYQVQQTPNIGSSASWQDIDTVTTTNSLSLPIGSNALFLRVRGR